MSTPLNEQDRWLAAEFALGGLADELRAEAAKRYDQDIEFRQEVDEWSERLSPMLETVAPVTPPAHVWKNIADQLNLSNPAQLSWFGKLFSNKIYGIFSAALAVLVLVVGIGYLPQFLTKDLPPLTAILSGEQAPAALVANYDVRNGKMIVTTNMQAADGHDHELWVIPGENATPVSMGVVAPTGTAELALSEDMKGLLIDGVTLAITVEPDGGAPEGIPTGPVIASGTLAIG
ncbi:anti-sigma factor [Maritalea sp.]|uniref:anti-sigma factor n=1 Tax=Maritalea sp. TaxID=2003361 RepID=UPI003EFA49DA